MKKRMIMMLSMLGILFGGIFAYKAFQGYMMKRYMMSQSEVVSVSAMKVGYSAWQPQIKASGTLRAVQGVNVTTEIAGMVKTIYFTPGAIVPKGSLLVQLNADSDIGQLQSLQANAALAEITYHRDEKQLKARALSQATVDADAANLKSLNAQVFQQAANVAKKTITAPFGGRLGISAVNPGQYVNPGDKVVTLQALDPIYADFYVPQQELVQLKVGQDVNLAIDAYPGHRYTGKITTIDPLIDLNTRNVEVEATIQNPTLELVPGMFATVTVETGAPQKYLTLPQTAISFNPYGSIVFVIQQTGVDSSNKPILTVKQNFVTTGETRGDQTSILSGLKEGDEVVTAGQLKLKNDTHVMINNSVIPNNNPAPVVKNEG